MDFIFKNMIWLISCFDPANSKNSELNVISVFINVYRKLFHASIILGT